MKATDLEPLEPVAIPRKLAIAFLGNSRALLERGINEGKIRPVIKGGRGCASLFDVEEVCQFWNSLKAERNQRGFTLVELLGVIAIIAVASALAISSINGAVGASREAAQKRQIQILNDTYAKWQAAGGTHNQWLYMAPAHARAAQLYTVFTGVGAFGGEGVANLGMPENMPLRTVAGDNMLQFLVADEGFFQRGLSMKNAEGDDELLVWFPSTGFHFLPPQEATAPSDSEVIVIDGNYGGHTLPTSPFE